MGIKGDSISRITQTYVVADIPALNALTGMKESELALVNSDSKVYRYDGTNWNVFVNPQLQKTYATVTGDTQRQLDAAEKSTNSASYVKLKEITITSLTNFNDNKLAVIKCKFWIKCASHNDAGAWAKAKVYLDGVAIGTEKTRGYTAYAEYTEDETINQGATHKIQVYCCAGAGETCYIKDFSICYVYKLNSIDGETLNTQLLIDTALPVAVFTNSDP